MNKKTKIGLFGFGVVGQGLYNILSQTDHFNAEVLKICVKNRHKSRPLPSERFTYDFKEILDDPEINLVVEVISDAREAYHIVTHALRHGKNVVTANKKMVAQNLKELIALQEEFGVSLTYEASSCGSIPIIRTLEEYFDNEPLHSIAGIFNGSSNFILSKIYNENLPYEAALKQAQVLGFAEADPELDVSGMDALNKLCIITAHGFGLAIPPHHIFNSGINNLHALDMAYAKAKGSKIKLLAMAHKVNSEQLIALVIPVMVHPDEDLYTVENEFNAVLVDAMFAGKQLFKGKGAGGFPTGAAILSDVSANFYEYRYTYKKRNNLKHTGNRLKYNPDFDIQVYIRYPQHMNLTAFLPVKDIIETGSDHHQQYVVGKVNLRNLLEQRNTLKQEKVFMMATHTSL